MSIKPTKKEILETVIKLCIDNHLSVMINMEVDTSKETFLSTDKANSIIQPMSKNWTVQNCVFGWGHKK